MAALIAKIASTLLLAGGTSLSGLSPLWLAKSVLDTSNPRQRSTLNALLAFSGGVLFATCFIHLLPDVHDQFESALPPLVSPATKRVMPWGELAACFGFFLIYGVEEVVEYFVCRAGCEEKHHHHETDHAGHDHHNHHHHHQAPPAPTITDDLNSTTSLSIAPSAVSYQNLESGRNSCMSPVHRIHGTHRKPHRQRHCQRNEAKPPAGVVVDNGFPSYQNDDERQSLLSDYSDDSDELLTASHDHHHDAEDDQPQSSDKAAGAAQTVQNTMRGVMLVLALSFHSIFEGLAIGLQVTASGVWTSFLAVVLHKLVMAFCVGVELLQLRTKRGPFVAHVVAFGLVAPVGIALGTIITETRWREATTVAAVGEAGGSTGDVVLASLQGLACGTLLYVTFFEVLTRIRGSELKSLLNFVAVLLGFALIVALHLVD